MVLDKLKTDKKKAYTMQLPDICRRRLLGYAETFHELARSFGGDFETRAADRQAFLEARQIWENRQVMGSNFNQVAQLMTRIAEEVFLYEPFEEKKKRQIIHAMREEGIMVEELFYIPQSAGRRAIGIAMYSAGEDRHPVKDAADMLSVLLDRHLQASVTSPYFIERELRSFILVEEPRYILLSGSARAVKENETVSGDNYAVIESEKGKITVLLSDGTGSGEEACQGSERVLDMMEKMLEAGYGTDAAVKLVNGVLFAGGQEQSHPTLDVCDLDLYQGSCRFFKVGGAASFLKRASGIQMLEMGSLPLGVFQSIEPEAAQDWLEDGDYLIFVTDGVLDALGEEDYEAAMYEVISRIEEQNPREIARRLLQSVICKSGGRILDDMTILVIGVWENSSIT